MHRFYENTMPFQIRDPSVEKFGAYGGPETGPSGCEGMTVFIKSSYGAQRCCIWIQKKKSQV
jgi:hypothetical protein